MLKKMAFLPVEVITEILLRLPAKPLGRFKSVCKEWYHLISDADFANLHYQQSLATRTNIYFVVKGSRLVLADYDTFENTRELNYPSKNPEHSGAEIVGLWNGLLLIWPGDRELTLYIFNPTTQTYKYLPYLPTKHPFTYENRRDFDFGFGYDSVSGGYKCVRVLKKLDRESGEHESEVMVYSSKTDSWKRGPAVPYYLKNVKLCHALLHETIHWAGEDGHRGLLPIMTFSLRDESFSSLPLPKLSDDFVSCMHIGTLDECLCLSLNYYDYYDIWVMKEYGVSASWTRQYRVQKGQHQEELERPIGFSANREKLFYKQLRMQVASIDLGAETLKADDVEVAGLNVTMDAHACVENLLMLPGRCH